MRGIKFINILKVDNRLREKVRQWRNKEEIRKYMIMQHIITRDEHLKWIDSLRNGDSSKVWVIFFKDIPIGSVYLQKINYKDLSSEWGFYVGEDKYRGRGLSKYILFKLLEIFFHKMQFKRLFTKVLSNNNLASCLYKKFEFKEINRLPFRNKKEMIVFEFTKEDWIRAKERLKDEYCSTDKR